MDTDRTSTDRLEQLFKQLPEAPLPDACRHSILQQIRQEAVRRKQRKERWELFSVSLASVGMIALAIAVFFYLDIPSITLPRPDLSHIGRSDLHFYMYIGSISLLLLFLDHRLRRAFRKEE